MRYLIKEARSLLEGEYKQSPSYKDLLKRPDVRDPDKLGGWLYWHKAKGVKGGSYKPKKLGPPNIRVEPTKSRVYVKGETFEAKDKLKNLGFKWDSEEKAWWMGKAKYKKVRDQVGRIVKASGGGPMFVAGKTYAIKDDLKRLGFRWDSERKAWGVSPHKWPEVKAAVDKLLVKLDDMADKSGPKAKGPKPKTGWNPKPPKPASPRAIAYAAKLLAKTSRYDWHDTDHGQGMSKPSVKDIQQWSAKEVSALIDDLKAMWGW